MRTEEYNERFEVDGNELFADYGMKKYFITFRNYEGKKITSEIPEQVFKIYVQAKKGYKKNQNEEERHWEKSVLTEITLYKRARKYQESIEVSIMEKEQKQNLHIAISKIPQIQQKRIKMKFFAGMKEKELAEKEATSVRAIRYSLQCGIKNLKKFKKFLK